MFNVLGAKGLKSIERRGAFIMVSQPRIAVTDDPVVGCGCKTDFTAGFFAFNPLVLINFLARRLVA